MDVAIFTVLVGIGLHITRQDIANVRQHVPAVIAGLLCFFGVMPFVVVGIIKVCDIHGVPAFALLLISTCPGGPASQSLSLVSGGNFMINSCITVMSTLVSVAVTPFLFGLLAPLVISGSQSDTIDVSIGHLLKSCLQVFMSFVVGIVIRDCCPKFAKRIQFIGGAPGIACLITVSLLCGLPMLTSREAAAIFLQLVMAALCGLTCAKLLKMQVASQKALIFEMMVRDMGVANLIIQSSLFEDAEGSPAFERGRWAPFSVLLDPFDGHGCNQFGADFRPG